MDRVVSLRDPPDGDKSIKLTAINIAKEAADLPRFFLAPFLTAFFLRLGGLAPGGSSVPLSVFDLCPVCLPLFCLLDLAVRGDVSRSDQVVEADSLRVLSARRLLSGSFQQPDSFRDEELFAESFVERFFFSELGLEPLRAVAAGAEFDLGESSIVSDF